MKKAIIVFLILFLCSNFGPLSRVYGTGHGAEPINMKYNFRSFITLLEQRNELVRIKNEVDPKFELAGILCRFQEEKKAVLFEKVKGSSMPVIGGLLNGMERVGLALGIEPTKKFVRYEDTGYHNRAVAQPVHYEQVDAGPVKEVIMKGEQIDVTKLPVPTFFEDDSGPFITAGIGVARNPETGVLNVGIYRALVLDRSRITINASPMNDLAKIFRDAEKKNEKMPIAMAIGVDPAIMVAAVAKSPPDISEIDVAGALMGTPVRMVKCETSDLLVPAHAEIIIEGEADFSKKISNQLGEFAGYYGKAVNPVITVTAVTYRRDALFNTILAGPSMEHRTLGNYALVNVYRAIVKLIKQKYHFVTDITLPLFGSMPNIFIAIEKKDNETPRSMIKEIFNLPIGPMPLSRIVKRIVIVDNDVDVYSRRDVEWAIWSRVATEDRIITIPDVESWELDYSAKDGKSVRVGIDATKDLADTEKLKKAVIPGFEDINMLDYME